MTPKLAYTPNKFDLNWYPDCYLNALKGQFWSFGVIGIPTVLEHYPPTMHQSFFLSMLLLFASSTVFADDRNHVQIQEVCVKSERPSVFSMLGFFTAFPSDSGIENTNPELFEYSVGNYDLEINSFSLERLPHCNSGGKACSIYYLLGTFWFDLEVPFEIEADSVYTIDGQEFFVPYCESHTS